MRFPRGAHVPLWAAALMLAGCSSMTTYRVYPGERAADEVAVIIWDGGTETRLEVVDGVNLPQAKLVMNRVEILPGSHVFGIRAIRVLETGQTSGTKVYEVIGKVEAGRCYNVHQPTNITSREGNYYLGGQTIRGTIEVPRLIDARAEYASLCLKRAPAVALTAKP